MKIYIDTHLLSALAAQENVSEESFALLNELIKSPAGNLWTSAVFLINIHLVIARSRNRENAELILRIVQDEFAIIPLRKSTCVEASGAGLETFEDQCQIIAAEAFGMHCIITHNVDRFKSSRVPVLTPKSFKQKLHDGDWDSSINVPFLDLGAQHNQIYNEIDDRITDIISNTAFILGKYVEEFEKGFAEIHNAKYCIGVSSGTDALHIALMTLGIGPGDAVIVPVNTFIATAEAVSLTGATPVFAECDEYYNIDTVKLRTTLSALSFELRTGLKAIIPVHLYGQPAHMDEIMRLAAEHGLKVLEDCSQAHLAEWDGRKVGSFGAFGAFSFYPGKNLGAYGEAGALVTNDQDLYEQAKIIRQHGEVKRYHHDVIGHNYRMEAIQGAVLATKLKYLENWTNKRVNNAQIYNELLSEVEGIRIPGESSGSSCVYHLYVIEADDRNGLQAYLQDNGIGTGIHYPIPIHLQNAYKDLRYGVGDFPIAEQGAGRILSLPMFPELTEGQIHYVCDTIKEYKMKK